MSDQQLYILMISAHGLIRGHDMELGRDADTGGQTTYVVELARALGRNSNIGQVDLLTRQIIDKNISSDYAEPIEKLGPNARIIRLPCGPRKYLRKELLWPHLDQMVDRCLHYLRQQRQLPDLIHTHYADAGYIGLHLSNLLGIPQIHTGHSLGRPKRARLLAAGRKEKTIERQFNLSQRIAAEEEVLVHASLIITSTSQEIEDQYGMYENTDPRRCRVIPPGTDTSRFSPPGRKTIDPLMQANMDRFLSDPKKPIILAICRPDTRKNIDGLVEAYGSDQVLRDMANLVIVAGSREDIRSMETSQREVMTDLLLDVDRYDLWGSVAIPKNFTTEDIPEIYRLAVRRRGIFINPALTEPFGLTLIEAAASGLPIIAPDDGGPRDIIANCRNGLLVNTLNPTDIANALKDALSDKKRWRNWSKNGIANVRRHYTWDAHVAKYVKDVSKLLHKERKRLRRQYAAAQHTEWVPISLTEKMIISDIDNTLLGDKQGLEELLTWLRTHANTVSFGVATGRTLESAIKVLKKWRVPMPDTLITSVGSEINYWPSLRPDQGWSNHIRHRWRREALAEALQSIPGLTLQAPENQREFKLSYLVTPAHMPPLEELYHHLHQQNLHAKLIYSHEQFLDVLPERASKGLAVRYLSYKWGLSLHNFLVAGDSGNDEEMLVGDTLAVVVGNHSPELEPLRGLEQMYFADNTYARGILEGVEYYDFAQ